jgi:hypothetical protein
MKALLAAVVLCLASTGLGEATNPPAQFIAKMYTEALGRTPDTNGWANYLNLFVANGCSQSTLQGFASSFYLGTEYASLGYGPAAKVLTSYRGILNREPDQAGFNAWYNYLVGGGDFAGMINSHFTSAEFANLVPKICGSSATYFFGPNPVISLPPSCGGFQGNGDQLQAQLNGTPPGQTVLLACNAVVPISSTLVIPAGVTLATTNLPGPTQYAKMARLVRQSIWQGAVVQLQPGSQLRSVWVEGQRGYLGADLSESRASSNVQTRGSGVVIQNSRFTDPTGATSVHALGTFENFPCSSATVSNNLVTGYATAHERRNHWSDGIDIACEHATVQGNSIVDHTDGGITLFRAHPATQQSLISNNSVLNAGNSAFMGIVVDQATPAGDGVTTDFTGAAIANNVIWTGPAAHIDMALTVGTRPDWFFGMGTGVSVTGNQSGGYPALRANTVIGVDGLLNATVQNNNFATQLVSTGVPCPVVYAAASVSAGLASGNLQPYVDVALDRCITSGHPNNTFGTAPVPDGDTRFDVAIYRPGTGEWAIRRSSDGGLTSVTLGGGVPAPADYDGDGFSDAAVFNAATGQWSIRRSSDGVLTQASFGCCTDTAVPADYDGDGRADIAVYRAGQWFILRSFDGAVTQVNWGCGGCGDVPVPADYDGDGRADIAVYRPTTGEWFILRSSDGGLTHVGWGCASCGDVAVPADYDGDGRTDIAVWRPTTGEWFILRSSDGGVTQLAWGCGGCGDIPVPADYDGDTRADIAVYRPGGATWYILQSTDGYLNLAWGVANQDRPVKFRSR